MHFLTTAGVTGLRALGIRTICDFRDIQERASEPTPQFGDPAPRIIAEDYHLSLGGIGKTAPGYVPTVAEATNAIEKLYSSLLRGFSGQYRRLFEALLTGDAPLLFHCTAGKDRTGVAAALVLGALGVPRDVIVADYILTNSHFDTRRVMEAGHGKSRNWRNLPHDVVDAYMAAAPSYIAQIFAIFDAEPGGMTGFLHDRLGLDAEALAELRLRYMTQNDA